MHDAPLIFTIAAAFAAAWVLGLITQRLRLSPIVGYLLAGIVIGPYTPGFQADAKLAAQLAEIGVSLLMFGVGLHFNLKDLLSVRDIAIPGAIGQSLIATILGACAAMALGWSVQTGFVLGMAMSVASTVVLMRVLMDNHKLDTSEGHIAVGWLVVEDIITVLVLVILPALGTPEQVTDATGHAVTQAPQSLWFALPWAIAKLAVMMTILLTVGAKVVPWMMVKVARLRSRELFTLTVLVMAIAVAAACSVVFGASMALGAFVAGMVVGRSEVSHQAAADALPLRDAFAVLFFCSVGMLFDPRFVIQQPLLMLMGLAIVLVGKPLAAMVIVAIVGYPVRTALTVAIGLAQIGEFSFILSDLGMRHGLLPQEGHYLLVGCAIVSITINPMLFRSLGSIEKSIKKIGPLWWILNRKADLRQRSMNAKTMQEIETTDKPLAVVLGYGPVGRTVDGILRQNHMETVVVDLNMETIQHLLGQGRLAIYGDASNIEVMDQAIAKATHLVISLPHSLNRAHMIGAAKLLNPGIKVFVRARYIGERQELEQVGADGVCYEEAEAAVGLIKLVMFDQGATSQQIQKETHRIRQNAYGDRAHF